MQKKITNSSWNKTEKSTSPRSISPRHKPKLAVVSVGKYLLQHRGKLMTLCPCPKNPAVQCSAVQRDSCVPLESRHVCEQVPWLQAKRAMTYARLKLAFSNYCYSAPLWPIVVRLVSVIFALSVYHIAKCRENSTLYIGFRGRRKFLINFQFSLAHKKIVF